MNISTNNISQASICTFIILSSLLTLTACGKKEATAEKANETQVVAKVNGDEISIHQINFQLSRMGQLNEAQSKQAAKEILARLVDQQLLKQKALENKLDRDPNVLQALETSKSQILAQAYLEQQVAKVTKPSASEVNEFYNTHPELFENRRIFKLQELAVEVSKDKYVEVEEAVKSKKTIAEMAVWLKSKDYKFAANSNVRNAEQIPLELLKKLQPLKDGDAVAITNEKSINLVYIAASQAQPITKDKATPVIEQYFLNQNKNALAKKEMDALKKDAKVEYVGAFAEMKGAVKDSPQALAPQAESPKTDVAGTKVDEKTQSHLDKGLAGF